MFKVKQKITKILVACLTALFAVVLAVGGIFAMPNTTVNAAEVTETLSIYGTTGTKASDSSSISWTFGDVTFVNEKAGSTTAIRTSDSSHYRVYAKSTVVISVTEGTISKIVITCTSNDYATVCKNSAGDDATVSGSVVTITPSTKDSSFTFSLTAQTRLNKVAVTYEVGSASGCEHNYESVVTAPTCEENGYTTHTCTLCGESYTSDTVAATGHDYVENETQEATCTAVGSKTVTCNNCDYNEVVELPKTAHNYVDGVCVDCGTEQPSETTASKTIAELIVSEGWTSSTTKQEFNLDEVVSVKVNGGSNTGKAYDGDHIRIYATDSPAGTLTISLAKGYELVSVTVSAQTGTYAFLCVDGSDVDISNVETAVSGSSVVLNSVRNGENGKQVRVTAIEVTYKPFKPQNAVNAINSYMNLSYAYSTDTVETDGVEEEIMTSSKFVIRCGIDASVENIANLDSFGIRVSAGGKTVDYNSTSATSWKLDEEKNVYYVVINLGDIINDTAKLGTEFTVQAYFVYDGTAYISTSSKAYSVASMIKEYKANGYDVTHLYNYLVSKGLIEEEVA